MDWTLQRLPGIDAVRLCGIRHYSPAGAYHVERIIDAYRPDCLLVELPSDASCLLDGLLDSGTIPPVAIVSWSDSFEAGSSVLPLADFSPEYRAIKKADGIGSEIRFIDLPSRYYLALKDSPDTARVSEGFDTDWELGFEHDGTQAYLDAVGRLSNEAAAAGTGYINDLRERYMRREIELAAACGYRRILVVAGAFHIARLALTAPLDEMTVLGLEEVHADCALIPYDGKRLNADAPGYLAMMHGCLENGRLGELCELYLTSCAMEIRGEGGSFSAGAVIEAARLARMLAAVRGYTRPCLAELREAAVCCFGGGNPEGVLAALKTAESLAGAGRVSQEHINMPIKADFDRQVKQLRLERHVLSGGLVIDLRSAGGEGGLSALRSAFFHRLYVLGSPFAGLLRKGALHSEEWGLEMSPDVDLRLSTSMAWGDTVKSAATQVIRERLDSCGTLAGAAGIISDIVLCDLPELASGVLPVLAGFAARSQSFAQCAGCMETIERLRVRLEIMCKRHDWLSGVSERLYLRSVELLPGACSCDMSAARAAASGINSLDRVPSKACSRFEAVLNSLAASFEVNPYLSGLALAVLMERGALQMEFEAVLAKRLSTGMDPAEAAGWFEGLVSRNLYALLSHPHLLKQLDAFVGGVCDDDFPLVLIVLRRALSGLDREAKRTLGKKLEELWAEKSAEPKAVGFKHLNDFDIEDFI